MSHPRMFGYYINYNGSNHFKIEPPPHVRVLLKNITIIVTLDRIIPACAGTTKGLVPIGI